MAQGTLTFIENFSDALAQGEHDLNAAADVIKVMLCSNTIASVISTWTDSGTNFTEVTGTGYTAGGETLTNTLSETGGTATYGSSADPAWTQNGAGPTDIRIALIYNTTATVTDAIAVIDMTVDAGTTPISLVSGDISITFPGGVIGTIG